MNVQEILAERKLIIREKIIKFSPFSKVETERIYNKYFSSAPRFVKHLVSHYSFHEKTVLEIGCSYGASLLYWGHSSKSIEVNPTYHAWLKALDVSFFDLNAEEDFVSFVGTYDAVITNNLFEHIIAPHLFLARINQVLHDGGLLVIGHPIVPIGLFRKIWTFLGYNGWLAGEHINFFTPHTVRLTLERAGFIVKEQFFPPLRTGVKFLDLLLLPLTVQCVSVCIKNNDYRYHSSRIPVFDPSWAKDGLSFFHLPIETKK